MNRNKEIVKSYYENLWNKKDKSYIDKLFDDNILFRGTLDIETNGKKEFEEYFDMILSAIPNLYHGVELMIAENNLVSARAIYNGTHMGKLFDIEATNRRIRYNGASFFRIENDKIKEIWVLGDLNSLYKQLTK
ncbi:ester cyclase [Arcobacter sp.]|uniref:ester cyclase n=1 Tax=Arcobacter sp. TaxID=1872629 RepID=UPI003D0BAB93